MELLTIAALFALVALLLRSNDSNAIQRVREMEDEDLALEAAYDRAGGKADTAVIREQQRRVALRARLAR